MELKCFVFVWKNIPLCSSRVTLFKSTNVSISVRCKCNQSHLIIELQNENLSPKLHHAHGKLHYVYFMNDIHTPPSKDVCQSGVSMQES